MMDKRTSASRLDAESLRLTAFLPPFAQAGEPTWWSDLTGVQSETRTSKPAKGEFQEAGVVQDNSLVLSIQPGRIDWFLAPGTPPADFGVPEFRSIGHFPEVLDQFVPLMLRWLGQAPPILRLAFGAIVLEPVKDKVAGYRRLSELLPAVHIDAEGSEDFFYQINRPRRSAIPSESSRVNRLSKWSVSSVQPFRLAVMLTSPGVVQSYQGSQVLACRIELDISTAAELVDEVPHDRLVGSFRELVEFGTDIALHGDIA